MQNQLVAQKKANENTRHTLSALHESKVRLALTTVPRCVFEYRGSVNSAPSVPYPWIVMLYYFWQSARQARLLVEQQQRSERLAEQVNELLDQHSAQVWLLVVRVNCCRGFGLILVWCLMMLELAVTNLSRSLSWDIGSAKAAHRRNGKIATTTAAVG